MLIFKKYYTSKIFLHRVTLVTSLIPWKLKDFRTPPITLPVLHIPQIVSQYECFAVWKTDCSKMLHCFIVISSDVLVRQQSHWLSKGQMTKTLSMASTDCWGWGERGKGEKRCFGIRSLCAKVYSGKIKMMHHNLIFHFSRCFCFLYICFNYIIMIL